MNGVRKSLSWAPQSNALWSQGSGFSFTSLWMPNPNHQHTMTFDSSGKHALVRLWPNVGNSFNKEVEIFPRCWMGSVWPLYLELYSLSLFWMKRVWLTAHNCWPSYKLRDIWPLKKSERLLRMADNYLLATLVPEQFDSADFFTHLEILLNFHLSSPWALCCALETSRASSPRTTFSKKLSSWPEGGNSVTFSVDFLTIENCKGTLKLRHK